MGLVTRNWERKRFYREASVCYSEEEGGYGVWLDQRRLRTPLRALVVLPTRPLALALAHEWSSVDTFIQPAHMPLTTLCNTVLDNPQQRSKVATVEQLTQYLATDTLCFHATEPDELVSLQVREWDPVISWFNEQYSLQIEPTSELLPPPPLSPHTLTPLTKHLQAMDEWSLTAFESCTVALKSLVLTCALFQGRIDVATATRLGRLEVEFQVQRWGCVEWQHSIEEACLKSVLSAALLLGTLAN